MISAAFNLDDEELEVINLTKSSKPLLIPTRVIEALPVDIGRISRQIA
jgi:hypothetical protein